MDGGIAHQEPQGIRERDRSGNGCCCESGGAFHALSKDFTAEVGYRLIVVYLYPKVDQIISFPSGRASNIRA